MNGSEACTETVPTVEQITERAAFMSRLVDGLLRGRSPPFARHEAAAAMSEVRAFVRAWRPTTSDRRTCGQDSEDMEDRGRQLEAKRPSSDALLKLAQKGVQLHNNARKLPQTREGGAGDSERDWKSTAVAYLRAIAASLVSLGSTSSLKDCANLCRLFSKAGNMLVEEAGDDIRALEMFDDAETFFRRLPGSFYGSGGQGLERLSLSAEDLVMAMHKASSRRIEVLSRTTGNVDQMVAGYEHQLKMLSLNAPAGLSVSTALHAASLGEERFNKGDCRGSSRLFSSSPATEKWPSRPCCRARVLLTEPTRKKSRMSLRALGGDLDAPTTEASKAHAGLRRTMLFSLAHCYSQSGDHTQAILCTKKIEDIKESAGAAHTDVVELFFAKSKVLCDAGDLAGAYDAAEALVRAMPISEGPRVSGGMDLDLATARMISGREDCSDRSLGLFAKIADRFEGTSKAVDARVALLGGLGMAIRLRSEGCGAGRSLPSEETCADGVSTTEPRQAGSPSLDNAMALAEKTADEFIARVNTEAQTMSRSQAEAALEGLVTIAENFHCRGEWEGCAKWCDLAIRFAKGLPNSPASPSKSAETSENVREDSLANAANSMLASLFTLRGEMECRLGDFASSSLSLDQALVLRPTDGRAREVAFWSAARDPARDESSLSARLSALSGSQAGLDPTALCEYLTSCAALVAGTTETRGCCSPDHVEGKDVSYPATKKTVWDSRVIMVEEHLLGALLANSSNLSPRRRHPAGKTSLGSGGACSASGCDDKIDGGECEPSSVADGLDAMEVQGVQSGDRSAVSPDVCAVREKAPVSTVTKSRELPHAVQVVASMVNRVLQCTSGEVDVREQDATDSPTGSTSNATPSCVSAMSRALLSIDKVLSSATALDIGPVDDPYVDFLAKACWNLAVICCGSGCGLPGLMHMSGIGTDGTDIVKGLGDKDRREQVSGRGKCSAASSAPGCSERLALAPGFFKASRQWTEIRADANGPEALLARQNCMVLGVAATLELHDSKEADNGSASQLDSRGETSIGQRASPDHRMDVEVTRSGHEMLEWCRKEVEVATGLNRQLSDVNHDMASAMRSILLVAEMSVLSRIGDTAAVRSLVAGREPDFLRCSANLLHYCVQLADDVLEDTRSVFKLCRLCIRRCLEDNPVDTRALGEFYRRLIMCASGREEALIVADEFIARARELQADPGMPPDDVDFMAAKCYNIGLQLLDMGRPSESERFVGKALGLIKIGVSEAFNSRWGETIHQVYRNCLEAKESDAVTTNSRHGTPASMRGSLVMSTGQASRAGRAFLPTGLFPIRASTTREKEA